MRIKNILLSVSIFTSMVGSMQLMAHSRYMLPSHTIISGKTTPMVALDLVVSNDFFHPDRAYGGKPPVTEITKTEKSSGGDKKEASPMAQMMKKMRESVKVTVTSPEGTTDDSSPIINFGVKSVTAVKLPVDGTYKMTINSPAMTNTFFEKADGSRGRAFGPKKDAKIPDGATDVKTYYSKSRVETFVTRNTQTPLERIGQGIELGEGSHPNDLFVGEDIKLQLLLNGKPVPEDTEVMLVREGTRHRNDREEIKLKTDTNGNIEFQFPSAGFYFMELSVSSAADSELFDEKRYGYSAVFEVWPQ